MEKPAPGSTGLAGNQEPRGYLRLAAAAGRPAGRNRAALAAVPGIGRYKHRGELEVLLSRTMLVARNPDCGRPGRLRAAPAPWAKVWPAQRPCARCTQAAGHVARPTTAPMTSAAWGSR
jgi:hypothetical protein